MTLHARKKTVTLGASRATKRVLAGTRGRRGSRLPETYKTVLRHIGTLGTPQSRLAEFTGIHPTRLSVALGEMEEKKLVKRRLMQEDARANLVMITAKGNKALDRTYSLR